MTENSPSVSMSILPQIGSRTLQFSNARLSINDQAITVFCKDKTMNFYWPEIAKWLWKNSEKNPSEILICCKNNNHRMMKIIVPSSIHEKMQSFMEHFNELLLKNGTDCIRTFRNANSSSSNRNDSIDRTIRDLSDSICSPSSSSEETTTPSPKGKSPEPAKIEVEKCNVLGAKKLNEPIVNRTNCSIKFSQSPKVININGAIKSNQSLNKNSLNGSIESNRKKTPSSIVSSPLTPEDSTNVSSNAPSTSTNYTLKSASSSRFKYSLSTPDNRNLTVNKLQSPDRKSRYLSDEIYAKFNLPPSSNKNNRSLPNTSNSCFFNASMQALASCPSFVSRCNQLVRLLEDKHTGEIKKFPMFSFCSSESIMETNFKLLEGFLLMIQLLHGKAKDPRSGESRKKLVTDIRKRFGKINKSFYTNIQQDPHEYLLGLLSSIDELMVQKKNNDIGADPMSHMFIVQLNPNLAIRFETEKCILCPSCNRENKNTAIHHFLQIPLASSIGKVEFYELLNRYFGFSTTDRKCPFCNYKDAYLIERMTTFPQCLMINLQRYESNGSTKNEIEITVPTHLDVSQFKSFATVDDSELKKSESSRNDPNDVDVIDLSRTTPDKEVDKFPNFGNVLLGPPERESSYDDCRILTESIKHSFNFKLMTDRKEIQDMLVLLNITHNEENLKKHTDCLEKIPSIDMKKTDSPGTKVGIKADGNCFFRAISWCLTGTQNHHKLVRSATVRYLEENRSILKNNCKDDYDEHVSLMKEDKEWATECEIAAVANLLKMNIYTYLSTGWNCQSPRNGVTRKNGSIYLNNLEMHYEPITSLRSDSNASREQRMAKRTIHNGSVEDEVHSSDVRKIRKLDESAMNDSDQQSLGPGDLHQSRRSCVVNELKQTSNSITYTLVAVICHYGDSVNMGHYVTYVKDLYNDIWFCSDDETFCPVNKIDMIEDAKKNAYLLFYERDSLQS